MSLLIRNMKSPQTDSEGFGQLEAKFRRLKEILAAYKKVLIAYSGGVDSTFLLKAAIDCLGRENVLAGIGRSASLPQSEYDQAIRNAAKMSARIEIVRTGEMNNPAYTSNSADRCFYCKEELYRLLEEIAHKKGYHTILCGNNADDVGDYRPGRRAAEGYSVAAPLEEAGMTKDDIRVLSRGLNLATWDKPAQPCLASRMAYGLEITAERLKQIEEGEAFLRSLGLDELRVRHHGNLVRIEAPAYKISELADESLRGQIVTFFKKLGFTYVSLDLEGFRSGSGNEILPDRDS